MSEDRDGHGGGAMGRLNAMDGAAAEPLIIVPATPPPDADRLGGPPTQPVQTVPVGAVAAQPTIVQPQAFAAVDPPVVVPVDPAPIAYGPRRDWGPAIMAAAVALLIGGLVGYLLGHASSDTQSTSSATSSPSSIDPTTVDQATVDQRVNDIFTMLLAQADQTGSVPTSTPYPKLDQLLAMSRSGAQASTPSTASAQTAPAPTTAAPQPSADVATLQQQLAQAEAARDQLQSQLDAQKMVAQQAADQQSQISTLQAQVAKSQTDLQAANDQITSLQTQLQAAQASNLNPQPLPDLVGHPIAEVRNLARTNKWQLIEQPVDNKNYTTDIVSRQVPVAGTTMITGSVLYVEVVRGS